MVRNRDRYGLLGGAALGRSGIRCNDTTYPGGTPGVLGHSNTRIKHGCGTVFQLTQQGGSWTKTVLHSFPGQTGNGQIPSREIVFDSQGNLYGTSGGGKSGFGTA